MLEMKIEFLILAGSVEIQKTLALELSKVICLAMVLHQTIRIGYGTDNLPSQLQIWTLVLIVHINVDLVIHMNLKLIV
ncbi:hypothetical protein RchiOBHm_Chr4g0385721 [Rosa chinensis]|uniref:Uncharacterized protein n=1 Tax=Rosa chinensis TaxID=74649 RepID=A0A2P6QP08_ROSCH|nr:hypothetical protein RchiOBHm_Chr4g0385721 [Rosa chinensis]